MNNEILNTKNKKYAEECFNSAITDCLEFKLDKTVKHKSLSQKAISSLYKMPTKSRSTKEVIKKFKNEILPYCTNFSSEKFMGFPDAGNSVSGITGAIAADILQQNLINSTFCAPVATFTEIAVINWLRKLLGYKVLEIKNIWDVGGIITYGGTGSNTTAMLLARENHAKNTMQNGITKPDDFKVLIPKGIGHYSITSSLMWLGCGNNVVEVESNNFKYDLNDLETKLEKYKGKIMAVVAYAGDSRTMTIDNLKQVHDIVKKHDKNIWLHVDACHGFSLAFSKKLRKKINGIEQFDSISTDPHKVLAIPYCISALLIKDPEKMKLITSTSDLIMQEDYAFGQITPFIGSKSWISLKLWFSMCTLGIDGYAKLIESRHKMAQYLKQRIENSDDFIVLNDVDINSVVFMYGKGIKNVEQINRLNKKIYDKMNKDGKYYLHSFTMPDNNGIISKNSILTPLRYMSGNDNINEIDIDDMLEYIRKISKEV